MDEKLIDYIKQSRDAHLTDEQIKYALLEAGWSEQQVKEAIGIFDEKKEDKKKRSFRFFREKSKIDKEQKSRSLFWQISTIYFTYVVIGSSLAGIIAFLLFPLIVNFNIPLLTTLRIPTVIVITLISSLISLYLGIIYISVKSIIRIEKIKLISFFVALPPVAFATFELISFILKKDYLDAVINTSYTYILGIIIFFYTATLLKKVDTLRNSRLARFGIRRLENIIIIIFVVIFYITFTYFKDNFDLIIKHLPKTPEIEKSIEKINALNQEKVARTDEVRILRGISIDTQLKNSYILFHNEYPKNLKDDPLIASLLDPNNEINSLLKDIPEEWIVKPEEIDYIQFDNGQGYKFCIIISTGEKCWEHSEINEGQPENKLIKLKDIEGIEKAIISVPNTPQYVEDISRYISNPSQGTTAITKESSQQGFSIIIRTGINTRKESPMEFTYNSYLGENRPEVIVNEEMLLTISNLPAIMVDHFYGENRIVWINIFDQQNDIFFTFDVRPTNQASSENFDNVFPEILNIINTFELIE